MPTPTDIRDQLNRAASEYLEAAQKSRTIVLDQIPEQVELIGRCLNRLADMVNSNGWMDAQHRVHRLNPEDIRKIVMTIDVAYKLQLRIVALPAGFDSLLAYVPADSGGTAPISIGEGLPPPSLNAIDITPVPSRPTPEPQYSNSPVSSSVSEANPFDEPDPDSDVEDTKPVEPRPPGHHEIF